MEPEILGAFIIVISTVTLSLLGMAWQVGRWQAKAEARSVNFCQRLSASTAAIDKLVKRYDESISDAHRRIDTHVDNHPAGR